MPAVELKPPAPLVWPTGHRTVFLAGSIEMGAAPEWQGAVKRAFADHDDLTLLNPRRDDWDSSWRQRLDDTRFRGQVEWELEGQERADIIAMYFAPETKAPITLLELGLFGRSGKILVGCPEGYWRLGNVEVVCQRYGVPLVGTLDALIASCRERLATASPR